MSSAVRGQAVLDFAFDVLVRLNSGAARQSG